MFATFSSLVLFRKMILSLFRSGINRDPISSLERMTASDVFSRSNLPIRILLRLCFPQIVSEVSTRSQSSKYISQSATCEPNVTLAIPSEWKGGTRTKGRRHKVRVPTVVRTLGKEFDSTISWGSCPWQTTESIEIESDDNDPRGEYWSKRLGIDWWQWE